RTDTGADAGKHPAARRAAERDGANAVDGDQAHRPVPFSEVPGAAHQRSAGADADEQHVKFRELTCDRGRGGAVVRFPVALVGVLVKPDVTIIRCAQRADVLHSRTEEAAIWVWLGDDV